MKKTLLILIIISFCGVVNAQTPNWLWAKKAEAVASDEGIDMAIDSNGNIVVVGTFFSSSIQFHNEILNNMGVSDNFIIKYSPNGNVIWAKSFGGISSDGVKSVSIDSNNNIIVVGYFTNNSISIDNFIAYTTPSNISADMFIGKLDSNGNALWLKSSGGMWDDSFHDVTTDNLGNIYATGSFEGPSISFGTIGVSGSGPGHPKACIVKYDSDGNAIWVKTSLGNLGESGNSITVDSTGNIYTCGVMSSASVSFSNLSLTNNGISDGFIVKHDTNGNVLWLKSIGGVLEEGVYDIAVDSNNNIYVQGFYYSPTLTFGSNTITNKGSRDFFTAKYNSAGIPQFIKDGGGTDLETLTSLTIDSNDNVYVSGWFWSNSITIDGNVLNKVGNNDIFIIKYSNTGILHWIKKLDGSTNSIQPNCVLANPIGEIYLTGYFATNNMNFDGIVLNNSSTYTTDFYLAKLDHQVLSVNENKFEEKIKISKNPFSDFTTVIFDKEYYNLILKIYNSNGTLVQCKQVIGKQVIINRENLPSGIYLINIIAEDNFTFTKKIIIN